MLFLNYTYAFKERSDTEVYTKLAEVCKQIP